MVRPGLLIGGIVLAVTGAFFLSLVGHWFPGFLLLAGLLGIGLAFLPENGLADGPPADPVAAVGLRAQLSELEAMRRDGLVSEVEAEQKRKALLKAWGGPPQS